MLCDSLGETAVHIATATGSYGALALLLQLGMDPNAGDKEQEVCAGAALCEGAESSTSCPEPTALRCTYWPSRLRTVTTFSSLLLDSNVSQGCPRH